MLVTLPALRHSGPVPASTSSLAMTSPVARGTPEQVRGDGFSHSIGAQK